MIRRLKKYYGKSAPLGANFRPGDVSAEKTNMAEIVKRFFGGESIPSTDTEKIYQYEDIEIGKDDNGNIITQEVLTDEALSLIPMTPNLDNLERSEYKDIQKVYDAATDKARSFVRQKQKEAQLKAEEKARQEYELLKKTFDPGNPSPQVEAPGIGESAPGN